ncbi:hypothetical protein P4U05_12195 [Bacillus paranthracis]|uniref:hypothetical protein n=1 Tax=Bacillus TaxID=1386 RepID=UPI000200F361|nr:MULTISPECIES: hypothetical protein [Bacillus]ADY24338.1 hypothetical protein YBT020_25555 [Bacillus thuringiensis serovar finitimus YBT-020]MCW4575063.1 hypothetical protein [Bacillus pacificus]MDA1585498.1 hypothetical protein [Bacillus cereus group sp. TH230-1LC]MRC72442.1 hypothetical protein [Bacillus thuringiensis]MCR6800632.1 hypothetical protein [Bacillus paranthracis]
MNKKKSIFLGAILSVLLSVTSMLEVSERGIDGKVEHVKIEVSNPVFFSDEIIGGHH